MVITRLDWRLNGDLLAWLATAVAVWDEGDPTLVGAASHDTKRVLRVRWHAVEAVVGALQCTPVLRGVALWESLRHGTDR